LFNPLLVMVGRAQARSQGCVGSATSAKMPNPFDVIPQVAGSLTNWHQPEACKHQEWGLVWYCRSPRSHTRSVSNSFQCIPNKIERLVPY